jgi:hypothetical protein
VNKIIYIYKDQDSVNGHSIFDNKLGAALKNQKVDSLKVTSYSDIIRSLSVIRNYDVFILSHFTTFKFIYLLYILGKKVVLLNHDLPADAYRNTNKLGMIKYLYFKLSYFINSKFCYKEYFISNRELQKLYSGDISRLVRVGTLDKQNPTPNKISKCLFISGNYKWSLKRKSLEKFLSSYDGRYEIVIDSDCEVLIFYLNKFNLKYRTKIKLDEYSVMIGLISDDFLSGFKLKTLELISKNCLILSFSDLRDEFSFIDNSEKYISYCESMDDFYSFCEDKLSFTEEDLKSFIEFKSIIKNKFNWELSATKLVSDLSKL